MDLNFLICRDEDSTGSPQEIADIIALLVDTLLEETQDL